RAIGCHTVRERLHRFSLSGEQKPPHPSSGGRQEKWCHRNANRYGRLRRCGQCSPTLGERGGNAGPCGRRTSAIVRVWRTRRPAAVRASCSSRLCATADASSIPPLVKSTRDWWPQGEGRGDG